MYILSSTHRAVEVALNQSFSVQLGFEILAELHQLVAGQTSCERLILLHHGPARVLEDQQTHVSDNEDRGEGGGETRVFLFRATTHFTTRRHCRLEDKSDRKLEMSEENDSLAEFLGFNEDVEVGFLQLLCKHAEDIGGGREISQVVNNQVEQQLEGDMTRKTDRITIITTHEHNADTAVRLCLK